MTIVKRLNEDGSVQWSNAPIQMNLIERLKEVEAVDDRGESLRHYDIGGLLSDAASEIERLRNGIKPVVIWLENGCDPAEAAKELALILGKNK